MKIGLQNTRWFAFERLFILWIKNKFIYLWFTRWLLNWFLFDLFFLNIWWISSESLQHQIDSLGMSHAIPTSIHSWSFNFFPMNIDSFLSCWSFLRYSFLFFSPIMQYLLDITLHLDVAVSVGIVSTVHGSKAKHTNEITI